MLIALTGSAKERLALALASHYPFAILAARSAHLCSVGTNGVLHRATMVKKKM
jgi:hypothetical protein